MIKDIALTFSSQIEVRVLREVDRRGRLRDRAVLDDQLVAVAKRVGDANVDGVVVASNALPRA